MSAVPCQRCPMCDKKIRCMEQHHKVCEFRQIKCDYCLFYIDHDEFDTHVSYYHSTFDVSCMKCGELYSYSFNNGNLHECSECKKCEQFHIFGKPCKVLTILCGDKVIPASYKTSRYHKYECEFAKICSRCGIPVCPVYRKEHETDCLNFTFF